MVAHGTPCLGPGHPCRLRGPLSHLRPRLLRLLRPAGDAEHRSLSRAAGAARHRTSSTSCGSSARSTPRGAVPRERAPAARGGESMSPAHDGDRSCTSTRSPGSRARAPCTSSSATARSTTSSCASTSHRGSSRRSCAGGRYTEPPDITARICGICPVAYQMSACRAIEDACGVTVDETAAPTCAASSTAASGSRATPARLPAPRTRLPRLRRRHRDGSATIATIVERGLAAEEDRQRS